MTRHTRLTDIQLVLLATAASRDNGSLLPPPETLGKGPARIRKAVQALIRRGLAIEADLTDGADVWRTEGDRAVGVVITDAGRAAIAVDAVEPHLAIGTDAPSQPVAASMEHPPTPAPEAPATEAPATEAPATKTAVVLDLLRRDTGATLSELVAATGWLPHTTRAALTGLRKKGHAIVRGKRDDLTCYTIDAEAVA